MLDKALRVVKRDSEGVVIDIDDSDNGEEENDRDNVDDQALCVLKRDSEGELIVIDDSDSEEEVPLKCMVLKRSKMTNNKCGALSVPLIGSQLKEKANMDVKGMTTFFKVKK